MLCSTLSICPCLLQLGRQVGSPGSEFLLQVLQGCRQLHTIKVAISDMP